MITARGENYEALVYKRKPNSAYEYEDKPSLVFMCRPASSIEKKKYRIIKGVNASTTSTYLFASNLPDVISDGDKIFFVGKMWTIESVGCYIQDAIVMNGKVMANQYILDRSPKGLTIL